MYQVVNMGTGIGAIVDKSIVAETQKQIPEETFNIGALVNGEGRTILK